MQFYLKNSKFLIHVFNAKKKLLESSIISLVETLPLKPDKWTGQDISQLSKLQKHPSLY